ncbi:MAG: hypothetical protein V1732_02310 [Patescibacteria group bacterium]
MNKPKKAAVLPVLALALIGTVCAVSGGQILSAISGIKASDSPVITNAFTDKAKYFPGDQMAITAETKNASEVKAFVENEKGYNEVNLVVAASFNGKETWTGKWKVENSLNGKKYKLKIVASNKSGTAETVLEWEDPNPGHPWSQIDNLPAACPAGQFAAGFGAWNATTGAPLTCATPAGGSPTAWTCEYMTVSATVGDGNSAESLCSSGYVVISCIPSTSNCNECAAGIVGGSARQGCWITNADTGCRCSVNTLCCK